MIRFSVLFVIIGSVLAAPVPPSPPPEPNRSSTTRSPAAFALDILGSPNKLRTVSQLYGSCSSRDEARGMLQRALEILDNKSTEDRPNTRSRNVTQDARGLLAYITADHIGLASSDGQE